MSVPVITTLILVGRWKPDARGRLMGAALELFTERGYEQTSVADIAERAGVTERTFFRHFVDKREVLFDGSAELQNFVVRGVESAPDPISPIDAVGAAMESAASLLEERRDYARLRAAAITANRGLQERELLKLSALGVAAAEALRARGVPDLAASLAGETGVTIFRVAFEKWIADSSSKAFAEHIRESLAELKSLTSGA